MKFPFIPRFGALAAPNAAQEAENAGGTLRKPDAPVPASERTSQVVKAGSTIETKLRRNFQEKRPANSPPASIHVHGMWFEPLSKEPRRLMYNDSQYRLQLITAYLQMVNGTRELPDNADVHLWTDRQTMHALLMPLTLSNGSEIEMPHSMLARSKLKLHYEGELEALISQISDKDLRMQLLKLYYHPVRLNIGALTDIVRLTYGLLYTESGKALDKPRNRVFKLIKNLRAKLDEKLQRPHPGNKKELPSDEINIHIDIDTLAVTEYHKTTERLNRPAFEHRYLDRPEAQLDMAKMAWKSTEASLANLKFPEVRSRQADEEIWPAPAPVDDDGIHPAGERETAKVPQPGTASENAVSVMAEIPNSLKERGINPYGREIDVLGIIPGHDKAIAAGKKMHQVLTKGQYKVGMSANEMGHLVRTYIGYKRDVQIAAKKMHELDGKPVGTAGKLDQAAIITYFRLAERIRQLRPLLQEKVDALRAVYEDDTKSNEERSSSSSRMAALTYIYRLSTKLIAGLVNKSTYFPQIAKAPRREKKITELEEFGKTVFGSTPISISSGSSWSRGGSRYGIRRVLFPNKSGIRCLAEGRFPGSEGHDQVNRHDLPSDQLLAGS